MASRVLLRVATETARCDRSEKSLAQKTMTWTTWVMVLLLWPVVGFGVAYLFGRFVRGVEVPEDASELVPPAVTYLRRNKKRAKTSSRVREATPVKHQRKAVAGH